MQSLYPGYTAPRLLKNGKFVFNARLHSGAQVDGRVVCFPADNPDLALVHYSFDSLAHYLDKLNRYTDGEALNLHRDGQPFHWQQAIRHFVQDFQGYYEPGQAHPGRRAWLPVLLPVRLLPVRAARQAVRAPLPAGAAAAGWRGRSRERGGGAGVRAERGPPQAGANAVADPGAGSMATRRGVVRPAA